MEFDQQTAAVTVFGIGGTTGLTYLGYLLYMLRKLKRSDSKEATVDNTWEGLVTALNAELERMHKTLATINQEIGELREKISQCESEKADLRVEMDDFKRRLGTRTEGMAT